MDLLLWLLAAVAQLAIAALGILAIDADFARVHFPYLVAAFFSLSAVNIVASGIIFARSVKFGGIVRQLTENVLFEIRGAPESGCRLHAFFAGDQIDQGTPTFSVFNDSEYPMKATALYINGTRLPAQEKEIPLLSFRQHIGDLVPGSGCELPRIKVKLCKEKDNRIDFAICSRSVTLFVYMYFTWNGNHWAVGETVRKLVKTASGLDREFYVQRLRRDFPFKSKGMWFTENEIDEHDKRTAATRQVARRWGLSRWGRKRPDAELPE